MVRPLARIGLVGLLLTANLSLIAWSRARIALFPKDPTNTAKEVLLLPPGQVIRHLDLGYHSLAADLLFIRANVYYGEHLHGDEKTPWLADFVNSLIEVDPDFKKAYFWGALVSTYNQRQVDQIPRALIERANKILEKGMTRFPMDPDFPTRIGYNLHYELGDPAASLPYFMHASTLPGAASWLETKVFDLYNKQGRKKAAKDILTSLVLASGDPTLNRALSERMALLMDEEERKEVESIRKRWQSEWKQDYPYLDYGLYLLVRQP